MPGFWSLGDWRNWRLWGTTGARTTVIHTTGTTQRCVRNLRQRKQDKKPVSPTHSFSQVLIHSYTFTHPHTHTILDAIQPYNTRTKPTTYTQKTTLITPASSPRSSTTSPSLTVRNLDGQVVPYQTQHGNFNNWWCRRSGVDNTSDTNYHKDNEIITRIEFPGSGHA